MRFSLPKSCALLVVYWAIAASAITQTTSQPSSDKAVNGLIMVRAVVSSEREYYGGYRDTYIVDITASGEDKHIARLVYRYPAYGSPARHTGLVSGQTMHFNIVRTTSCDVTANQVQIPKGKTENADPNLQATLASLGSTQLPCFVVVRNYMKWSK